MSWYDDDDGQAEAEAWAAEDDHRHEMAIADHLADLEAEDDARARAERDR